MRSIILYLLAALCLIMPPTFAQEQIEWEVILDIEQRGLFNLNPLDHTHIYTVDDSANFVASYDRGETWHIRSNVGNDCGETLVISPGDTNIMIMELEYELLRSEDAGVSWDVIFDWSNQNGETVCFDPKNADVVYFLNFHVEKNILF